ncbi:MAG: FKBP-type peptidyl-prolyl cis-trans isomerase [Gemmatimonadota bacterium]|nr:FKBP-type peptidyl-prolyl cis-trans isomerase [Gemmatimonadota bacterium]
MQTMSKRASRPFAVVLTAVMATAACGDSPTEPPPFEVIEEVEFHESLGVDLDQMTETESGLYYQDLVEGDGAEATSGAEVTLHYLGRLRNGEPFDSTEVGDPFTFTVDNDEVIDGFDEGVLGMRVGGERKIVIPPELAYGVRGSQGILVFDLELVEVVVPEPDES